MNYLQVKALKAEIDNKSGKMTPDSLLILLEAACSEAEEVILVVGHKKKTSLSLIILFS